MVVGRDKSERKAQDKTNFCTLIKIFFYVLFISMYSDTICIKNKENKEQTVFSNFDKEKE